MKKLLLLFALISVQCFADTLLERPPYAIPCLMAADIDVCSLPSTNTGTVHDWLIKEDSSCSHGTKKMTVADFMTKYVLPYILAVQTDSVHVGVNQFGIGNPSTGLLTSNSDNVYRAGISTVFKQTSGGHHNNIGWTPFVGNALYSDGSISSSVYWDSTNVNIIHSNPINGTMGIQGADAELNIFNYSHTWKWPHADGTNGQMLQTDGGGTLSWQTPPAASSNDTSGVFFPTFTPILNVTTVSNADSAQFIKVGRVLTMNFYTSITPTSTGASIFTVTIPFTITKGTGFGTIVEPSGNVSCANLFSTSNSFTVSYTENSGIASTGYFSFICIVN